MDRNKLSKPFQNVGAMEFSGNPSPFPDLLDFSIGDPDLSTDCRVIQKACEAAIQGDTHYTPSTGKEVLKEAIRDFHKDRLHQEIGVENIQITSSATHAMYLVMKAILNPGDEVIVFAPFFPNYLDQISFNGGIPKIIYTRYENSFEILADQLEEAITPRTKAIVLNNPTNPTGRAYSKVSYETVAKAAKEHDLLVLCDDIYTNFVFDGIGFEPLANLDGMFSRCIQIRSFSKNYLMTGWRLGYIVADPILIEATSRINESVVYAPNTLSQNAALYALAHHDELTKPVHEIYAKRLQAVYECVQKSRYFKCLPISGTFYVFMDIRATGMDATEFSKFVYEKAHVKVFRGDLFGGERYKGFVRLAVNLDSEKIIEAFERLESLPYPGVR